MNTDKVQAACLPDKVVQLEVKAAAPGKPTMPRSVMNSLDELKSLIREWCDVRHSVISECWWLVLADSVSVAILASVVDEDESLLEQVSDLSAEVCNRFPGNIVFDLFDRTEDQAELMSEFFAHEARELPHDAGGHSSGAKQRPVQGRGGAAVSAHPEQVYHRAA